MRPLHIEHFAEEALPQVAQQLLSHFPDERFFAFFAEMGVGKTTLIKAICRQLGVDDNVCSPTFAIINEYHTSEHEAVYHFDFYRLKRSEEAYDIGCEEYFYSGCYCLVEWPEVVESLLPSHYVRVALHETAGLRTLDATLID